MRQESGGPVRVDVGWSGGELLELGPDWSVRILHVPGHSVGHVAVYDERSGALFSGDCLQGSVYLGLDGTPKLCPTYTHVDDYLATATLIESLAPRELPRLSLAGGARSRGGRVHRRDSQTTSNTSTVWCGGASGAGADTRRS